MSLDKTAESPGLTEVTNTSFLAFLAAFKGVKVVDWEKRGNRMFFKVELTPEQVRAYEGEYGTSVYRQFDDVRRYWVDKTFGK